MAKEANTYTNPGQALPSFIEEDGTKRNQSQAILLLLCMRHGVVPQSAQEEYEMHWYFETKKDHEGQNFFPAFAHDNCDEQIINDLVAVYVSIHQKCEEHWADGRQYVAGDNITAADYSFLAHNTMLRGNTGLKNPSILTKLEEQAPMSESVHVARVLNNIKAQCQASVDALQPSFC